MPLAKIFMYYSISVVTLPPIILFLLIMYIYSEFVLFILGNIENPLNITRLPSSDSYWRSAKCQHDYFIDTMFILNSKSKSFDEVVNDIKKGIQEKIINNSKAFPKLTSVVRKFMGYTYLLRTKVDVEELVIVIKAEEEQSLGKVLGDYANNNRNEKFLWEIVIVKASNDWKKKNSLSENQIPIFLRVSHMVGDGMAITNLLVHTFDGKNVPVEKSLKKIFKKNYNERGLIKRMLEILNVILITPGYQIELFFKGRKNVWDTPLIEKERRYFYAVEPNVGMVELVKSMKNQLNAVFTDIMVTSIAASLQSYLKKLPEVPEHSLMGLVYFREQLSTLYQPDGNPNLQNQFSYMMYRIPISGKDMTLLERLKLIREERKVVEASPQRSVISFVFNKVNGLLPDLVIPYIVDLDKISTSFSNIPGVDKLTWWNYDVDQMYFFPPQKHQLCNIKVLYCVMIKFENKFLTQLCNVFKRIRPTGVNFCLVTLNNKINIGLVVDKSFKASEDDCQNLVNGVLDNIMRLKEELLNKNV